MTKTHALAAAIVAAMIFYQQNSNAANPRSYRFDISEQSLSQALRAYGQLSGQEILFTEDLVSERTVSLSGEYTLDRALHLILDGTGLASEKSSSGVVMIKPPSVADDAAHPAIPRTENDNRSTPPPTDATTLNTITVTGTHIRGVTPPTSAGITLDRRQIEESGHQSTEALLRSIPQVFGGGANSVSPRALPDDIESNSNMTAGAGVNLRGLGASSTLVLINGRRIAPSGTNGSFVDVSAIPVSAIERIEMLTDGASSIYGGDAVSGVVNFILRSDYEGAESSVQYGFVTEGDLSQLRISQTGGVSWENGHAMLSYDYFKRDPLFTYEKKFSSDMPYPVTLLPGDKNHSILGNLSNRLTDSLDLNVTGLYTKRDGYRVFDRFGSNRAEFYNEAQTKLLSPKLEWDIAGGWNLVLSGDYSQVNELQNLTEHRDPSPLSRETRLDSSQNSIDLIASGPILNVATGNIRGAIGVSHRQEKFQVYGHIANAASNRSVKAIFGELLLPIFGNRNAIPGFQMLDISISARLDHYSDFGTSSNPKLGIRWSPVEGLQFRGSYGTSFNPPDLGVIGKPGGTVVAVTGNNPSPGGPTVPYLYVAGSASPNLGAEESRAYSLGTLYERQIANKHLSISANYYNYRYTNRVGAIPTPPGLRTVFDIPTFRPSYPDSIFTDLPSGDAVRRIIEGAVSGGGIFVDYFQLREGHPADLDNMSFIADLRTRNLASSRLDGVDLELGFDFDTEIGYFATFLNGNYILRKSDQASATSPDIDVFNRIFYPVDLRLRGGFSWSHRDWSLSGTINHTDSYLDDRIGIEQMVDSWTTIDLTGLYTFRRSSGSLLHDVRVSMSILNLLDTDPPFVVNDALGTGASGYTGGSFDGANAYPMGRFVSFSISKKW